MPQCVILEFRAAEGRLEDLLAALKAALPDTRAYEGCLSLDSWLDSDRSTVVLVELWESKGHFDRYLEWRAATPEFAEVMEMVEGGAPLIRHCVPAGC